mmetsp:Transcript_81240/g.238679  ORF Transcript_81240/g.238679 Transcript_81240/m.238679 type:complete len:227 (+) Transcript_81240:189-869(+)
MRAHLEKRWWHWGGRVQHPRKGLLHSGHERLQQRPCAAASELQRDGALRPAGRWQAEGLLCHLPGALARRRLRLPRAQEEPWEGGAACARPLLRPLGARPLHAPCQGRRRVDTLLPKPGIRRGNRQGPHGRVGSGIRRAVHGPGSCRQGLQDSQGPAALVPDLGVPDGNGHPLHAVQGPCEQQVEPAEPWHHPQLQSLHGDHSVHLCRRGGRLQPGLDRSVGVCQL